MMSCTHSPRRQKGPQLLVYSPLRVYNRIDFQFLFSRGLVLQSLLTLVVPVEDKAKTVKGAVGLVLVVEEVAVLAEENTGVAGVVRGRASVPVFEKQT